MNALTSCLVEFDYFIHVTLVQEGTESQLFCGCVVLGAVRYLRNLVLHLYHSFFEVSEAPGVLAQIDLLQTKKGLTQPRTETTRLIISARPIEADLPCDLLLTKKKKMTNRCSFSEKTVGRI